DERTITVRLHNDDGRIVACSALLARIAALMKTRYQNWPSETDAEIRVFVLGFAIRRPGRTQQRPHVRAHFPPNREVVKKHARDGWGARIRTWEWRNQNPLPYHLATPQRAPDHTCGSRADQSSDGRDPGAILIPQRVRRLPSWAGRHLYEEKGAARP